MNYFIFIDKQYNKSKKQMDVITKLHIELGCIKNSPDYNNKLEHALNVFTYICDQNLLHRVVGNRKFQLTIYKKVIEMVRGLAINDESDDTTNCLRIELLDQLATQVQLYREKQFYWFMHRNYSNITTEFTLLHDRTINKVIKNRIYDIMESHKFPIRRSGRLNR